MKHQTLQKSLCMMLAFIFSITTARASQMGTIGAFSDNGPLNTLGNGAENVVLNELMLFPSDDDVWVELYNAGNDSVSVDDWLVSDEDGLTYALGDLPDMPSGGYLVIRFEKGTSDTYFGETQPNALHIYTGWKNVRWTRHVVDSDFHYSRLAFGIDIIPGGKPEIIANRFGGNEAHLYEPQADMSQEWILTPIAGTGPLHRTIPADMDSDGHTDLLYNYYFGNEAGGNPSIHWMKAPITTPKDPWAGPFPISQIRRPEGLDAGKINGDNNLDVVAGGKFDNEIRWYEAGANPTIDPWTEHSIDLNFNQPGDLELVDLDGDNDLDLVAAGSHGEEVVWYEHPVNPANAWLKHTIKALAGPPSPPTCSEYNAVGELIIWDIDNDQKLDVVVSEGELNRIVWYRYDIDPTEIWTEYVVDDNVPGPSGMDIGDIDGDGDLDLVVGATGGMIAWYPQPVELYDPNWPRYIVDDSVHLTFHVNATDMDGDGDLDLVSADQNDNRVLWYENDFLEFAAVDQAALFNSTVRAQENIIDFVAWGGPALGEDSLAVGAGIWTPDDFVDMTTAGPNWTLARDRFSQDNDVPGDWNPQNGVDSDIPTKGTMNYPNPTNVELRLEYNPIMFRGGSDPPVTMPPGLVLANYSSYTFSVEIENPFGWNDMRVVSLDFNLGGGDDIFFLWFWPDDTFAVASFEDVDHVILLRDSSNAWTDGVYVWIVNFTLFFHWWYPSEGPQNVSVSSTNLHGYHDRDNYSEHFTFVKRLRFSDQMQVSLKDSQQKLVENAWISPWSHLEVSGPKVIYDTQGGEYYPGDGEFNVILEDSEDNSRMDYTSAGYPVSIPIRVPNYGATTTYVLTLALTDLPKGAIPQGNLTHHLNVDADVLQFDQPSPSDSVWHKASSLECGVRISDLVPGSGVLGASIEYRVANESVDRFGEWISVPMQGTDSVMEPSVTCELPEGPNNWIQWRAADAVGNGPTISPAYQIPVDTRGVSYHQFYPASNLVQPKTTVTVNITLADFGGSGVDISTLQVKVKPSSGANYTTWFVPDYGIVNQTAPTTTALSSGPETIRLSMTITNFQNGTENYIKLRVRDKAGNDYTESEEYRIRVDTRTSEHDDTIPDEGLNDWLWIVFLSVIIGVLALVTVLNRKRGSAIEEDTQEEDLITQDGSEEAQEI